jgi:diadenosine tetraphosphate (Ap4A) HIT family hydrolase
MSCTLCSITDELAHADQEYVFVNETPDWVVSLAPNQSLLGRCVVRLRRHAESVAQLTDTEVLSFRNLLASLEQAAKAAFGATMFNWSCYMNFAYRKQPPEPHVHWWLVPRYAHSVVFWNMQFEDPHFGSPYDHARWYTPPVELRQAIATELSQQLVNVRGRDTTPR